MVRKSWLNSPICQHHKVATTDRGLGTAQRQAGTVSVRQCRLVVGMGKATNSVGFFFSEKMNDDEGKGVGMMLVITGPH